MSEIKLQVLVVPMDLAATSHGEITSSLSTSFAPMKKFLHITDSGNRISDLVREIIQHFAKLYPREKQITVANLQNEDLCEVDFDYKVLQVFEKNDLVRVIVDEPSANKHTATLAFRLQSNDQQQAAFGTARTTPSKPNTRVSVSPVSLAPPELSVDNTIPVKKFNESPASAKGQRITSGMLVQPPLASGAAKRNSDLINQNYDTRRRVALETASANPENGIDSDLDIDVNSDVEYPERAENNIQVEKNSRNLRNLRNPMKADGNTVARKTVLELHDSHLTLNESENINPNSLKSLQIEEVEHHRSVGGGGQKKSRSAANIAKTKTDIPALVTESTAIPKTLNEGNIPMTKRTRNAEISSVSTPSVKRSKREQNLTTPSVRDLNKSQTPADTRQLKNTTASTKNTLSPPKTGRKIKEENRKPEKQKSMNILQNLHSSLSHMQIQLTKYKTATGFSNVPQNFADAPYHCKTPITNNQIDVRLKLTTSSPTSSTITKTTNETTTTTVTSADKNNNVKSKEHLPEVEAQNNTRDKKPDQNETEISHSKSNSSNLSTSANSVPTTKSKKSAFLNETVSTPSTRKLRGGLPSQPHLNVNTPSRNLKDLKAHTDSIGDLDDRKDKVVSHAETTAKKPLGIIDDNTIVSAKKLSGKSFEPILRNDDQSSSSDESGGEEEVDESTHTPRLVASAPIKRIASSQNSPMPASARSLKRNNALPLTNSRKIQGQLGDIEATNTKQDDQAKTIVQGSLQGKSIFLPLKPLLPTLQDLEKKGLPDVRDAIETNGKSLSNITGANGASGTTRDKIKKGEKEDDGEDANGIDSSSSSSSSSSSDSSSSSSDDEQSSKFLSSKKTKKGVKRKQRAKKSLFS